MTIYGHGYRARLAGYAPEPVWRRLWPIARHEFRTLFRTVWGVVLFVFCLLPSVFNLVVMLITLGVLQIGALPRNMPRHMPRGMSRELGNVANMLPDHVEFYVESILERSLLQLLILTAFVGCRAIAKDRASNALELYWTRGIGPRGYFFAKWGGSFLLLLLVAVVAPLMVWVVGVFVAEDWGFLQDTIGFMPRVLLGHGLFVAVVAWLALSISGMVQQPNFASVLWLILVAGSGAVAALLSELLDDAGWTRYLGLWQSLGDLDRWIAGAPLLGDSGPHAAVSVLVYVAVLTLLMLRRMRRQEAIA